MTLTEAVHVLVGLLQRDLGAMWDDETEAIIYAVAVLRMFVEALEESV